MRTRWEYHIEWLKEYIHGGTVASAEDQSLQLDYFGFLGWEAYAVVGLRVFMKRPLLPTEAEVERGRDLGPR